MTFRLAARGAAGLVLCAALVFGGSGAAQAVEPNEADVDFILAQIKRAEAHAAGGQLAGPGPNQVSDPLLPHGLRTVNGEFNNIVPGQEHFGSADRIMPRLLAPFFRNAESGDPDGPGPAPDGPTSYTQTSGFVLDSKPRTISNLIVDASGRNPAAVAAASANANAEAPADLNDPKGSFFLPNVAPDVGLSAPYNSWFTLFGQFFDHGLDLTTKGGSGTVVIPLKADDPLFVPGSSTNFMVLTRATNQKGPDGLIGTADDVRQHENTTTPFVDQNQTYTSHPSHQVFLREYELLAGKPVANGRLLDRPTAGGLARWTDVKAQALTLGITLSDQDVLNVPLVLTDQYGKFIPNASGAAQIVTSKSPLTLKSGTPTAPVNTTGAVRTNHAFLDDIAHAAAPFGDHDGDPGTPKQALAADTDTLTSNNPPAGTYDNELLEEHFITGDGRGNENIGLTAVHHVFHTEHNIRVQDIKDLITPAGGPELTDWQLSPGVWNGERLFQAARFVTEMEYQHLVFEEFARKVQPQVNLFAGYDTAIDPAIVSEFANVVYRFGHSMLTETVSRTDVAGAAYDIGLIPAFLNPLEFRKGPGGATLTPEQAAGGIVRGMTRQVGNELDEFVTGALRNNLVGLPLDLATINLARGRDTGVPSLNKARAKFFAETSNSALKPYSSWNDFKLGLRNQPSLVNFVAAYGTHSTITGAGTVAAKRSAAELIVNGGTGAPADRLTFLSSPAASSGVDDVDFWVGGLAEKQMVFGGLLGSTFNFVFEVQMEKLQDADRLYYLSRNAGLNFLTQLEESTFSELINRTTDTKHLPGDSFSRPDFIFEFANINAAGAGPITDDPKTPYDESVLLNKEPDGNVRFSGAEHTVFGGTEGDDKMQASEGDDTLWGDGGNDKLEGGDGVDQLVGDLGDDILTDLNGDDNLKGGKGNDALNAGPGFDLVLSGPGNDFVVAGSDPKETFAGQGDDFVIAGDAADTVFGGEGGDWIEGGGQADLLQGENGDPFQQGRLGDDVIDGGGGNDDYDSEGGDDIQVAGTGTERMEGQIGYDWSTYAHTAGPADADLAFTGLLPPDQNNLRDRFDFTEGLSGWNNNDILRGDDANLATLAANHTLTTAGIAKISGLQAVLGTATSYAGGNIIMGGDGSDLFEGRGGDDIIDGDRWLNVRLSVRTDVNNPATETQTVNSMSALQAAVFAGTINPGKIAIVREIITPAAGAFVDTAVFSGPRAEYDITPNLNRTQMTVTHARGSARDGADTVRNVEKLQFSDQTVSVLPLATVSPTSQAFGDQPINTTSAARTTTLTNTGNTPLSITSVAIVGTTEFARPALVAGNCPAGASTLNPGASCTIPVTFRPTTTGAKAATLRITSNTDGVAGSQTDVALTGTGVPSQPLATVSPTSQAFGNQLVLTTSAARTTTLTNTGNLTLTIAGITIVGTNANQFARPGGTPGGTCARTFPGTLAAGASCTVTTTFSPTTGGAKAATLEFTSNSGNVTGTKTNVPLTGTGVNGGITVTPTTLAFGNVQAPTLLNLLGQSADRDLTVRSTGPGALIISSIQFLGTFAGDYSVLTNGCTGQRAVNTDCIIRVRFTPSATGARNATMRLNTNAAPAQKDVPLTGTGT